MTTTESQDYRPVAQQAEKPTLTQMIERMKPEIARALPRHMNPDRMARIATTVLRQTPALGRCTPESFLGALMTASQLGLEPGPLGEAYFVPYGKDCTFIPGYRGLVKLALQSPNVSKARARVVHENDEFDYAFGINEHLDHKPVQGDRGKVTHVYAFVKYVDGGSDFDVMTVADVEKVRKRSKASGSGPWVSDWDAMAMKTVFKRLSKWMPLSSEFATAAAMDGVVRTDAAADLVDVTPSYIEGEFTDAEAIEPTPEHPEIEMVTTPQTTKLAIIRDERYPKTPKGRAEWFGWVATTIGREISSNTELTKAEAMVLLDVLEPQP
jgi:recombination protein RecT